MVAKIITGKSIRGALHYNENKVNKGDAYLVLASGFAGEIDGMDFKQKLERFKHLTDLNAKVKTNTLHISLNFHAGDKVNDDNLRLLATEYMEGIGFGEQPFLVYRHSDSAHPHVHIVSTNIQRDGSRMDLHDIGKKRSEPVRKALEVKYGLIRAEGQEKVLRELLKPLVYGGQPTKRAITNIVSRVSREYAYGSFAEYKAVLAHFGVHAERGQPESRMFEKKGLQYFAMDSFGQAKGVPIKASSIYGKPTMVNLEKRYEKNGKRKQECKLELKAKLDKLLVGNKSFSEDDFHKALKRSNVTTVFRKSEKEQVYGLTYLDHELELVINGSEMGKDYSAKAVMERFEVEAAKPVAKTDKIRQEISLLEGSLPSASLPLLELLGKADNEPLSMPKKKKRRKGRNQSTEINR